MNHGKSTLVNFIISSLYGIGRTKDGKLICDYEKYMPWNSIEYSGKILYKLDDGTSYEIYRDFKNKNPQIYDNNANDITNRYPINKFNGSTFFEEQTETTKDIISSTNFIIQGGMKLSKDKQNTLIQKITNIVSTGNEDISYKKTIDRLSKKLIEEVGTERTTERPINIINSNLNRLELEKNKLKECDHKKVELEEKNKYFKFEATNKTKEIEIIKEIKRKKEEENIEDKIINVNESTIKELENKKQKISINNDKEKSNKINFILIALFITMAILITFVKIKFKYLIYIVSAILIIYLTYKINKNLKTNNKIRTQKEKNEKEFEILNSLILEKTNENNDIKLAKEEKNMLQKNLIKNKYNLTDKILEDYFACNLEELKIILERKENELKQLNMKIYETDLEYKDLLTLLEKKSQIEEELEGLKIKKEQLNSLSNSIKIAKNTLEEAYYEMKQTIIPSFTDTLSNVSRTITKQKYKNIKINDEEGLIAEKENGEYIDVGLLSTGTIEQIYFALRLSIAEQINKEKMPIILDEAFVYYDNDRLKETLLYLSKQYRDYQILILTCSDRESNILDELGINYNKIQM